MLQQQTIKNKECASKQVCLVCLCGNSRPSQVFNLLNNSHMQLKANNPQQGLSPPFFCTNYRNKVSKKDTQVSRHINTLSSYFPAVRNKSSAQEKTKKETKENKGSIELQLFIL